MNCDEKDTLVNVEPGMLLAMDLRLRIDELVEEAIEEVLVLFFDSADDEQRKRVCVSFGPNKKDGVLFRKVVFLDKDPKAEVILVEEDDELIIRKQFTMS
jgi:hypothetical protein